MGILAEAAMDRVASGSVDVAVLINTAQDMFAQKHLMLYFPDLDIANLVADYGWDGALPQRGQDYVMIVEANRSLTMIGFDVAPVAPMALLLRTNSGSIESSHNFVPVSSRVCIEFFMADLDSV